MVISSEFRMEQYRDVDHQEGVPHFIPNIMALNSFLCEKNFYLEATANCNTMNSTIKTDLTAIEVEQLFQIEYERLLTQNQNFNIMVDSTHVFTWTGSVKISVSSIRNELGETFTLKDFIRNRSISRSDQQNFDQIYSDVSHFPQASSFQNPFLIRKSTRWYLKYLGSLI